MYKILIYVFLFNFFSLNILSAQNKIFLASTTSTYDTGLLEYLNIHFKDQFNINVQVLSQGTGQAIRVAKDGNVEVLLVHHKKSELEFMNNGYGIKRYEIMYNDFIIVGPKEDFIKCDNFKKKLIEIFNNEYIFVSRGDDSGTHKKELELWKSININPNHFKKLRYLNVGQGMGNTLLITNEKFAYTIVDRASWISFKKKENLKIICESHPPLFNQYGLILVNPAINNKLNYSDAKIYVDWLISEKGKYLINNFKKNGKQLFFYNFE